MTQAQFAADCDREWRAVMAIAAAAVKDELSRAYVAREQSPFVDLLPCACGKSVAPTDDDDTPEFDCEIRVDGYASVECPGCGFSIGAWSAVHVVRCWNLIADAS